MDVIAQKPHAMFDNFTDIKIYREHCNVDTSGIPHLELVLLL